MIRHLSGVLVFRDAAEVVVSCSGVGYSVEVPARTPLPPVGERVDLWTHLRVREDALDLFGFATREELALFEAMLRVPRFPAKVALAVISHCGVEGFRKAVAAGDLAMLKSVPGIGAKTAQQLLLQMRGKIEMDELEPARSGADLDDATLALVELGYSESEAKARVARARAECGDPANTAEIIRSALRKGK